MLRKTTRTKTRFGAVIGAILLVTGGLYSPNAHAFKQVQAKMVVDEMTSTQASAFISGLVEGIAYARYVADGKKRNAGMKCILEWYHNGGKSAQKVMIAFDRYREFTANAVVGALLEKECGR